ncbi:scavenger receptor cysteine-rich type 1 protein M130-like [Rhincodon typus]|uniref:scavenger receptor cysteine-rich type 1 protein M130-like n=1 Tax=Rhincodon typus TaxID=259920 RepID=UPI00202F80E5|nr:scavenger receptor cysteine-rich type 1 protein M130-like [Rhincodon typus]
MAFWSLLDGVLFINSIHLTVMRCQASTEQFQVRIVNGDNECSGRVEVFYNKTWGTVCDDGWDLSDAQVVCTELSCGFAQAAPGSAKFGKGLSSIWLDSVQCNGSESNLWQCQSNTLGQHDCQHSEDASALPHCMECPRNINAVHVAGFGEVTAGAPCAILVSILSEGCDSTGQRAEEIHQGIAWDGAFW